MYKEAFIEERPKQQNCRLLLFFAFLLLIAYSNSFTASWQMDDAPNIVTNVKLHMAEISSKAIWDSMTASPAHPGDIQLYRPVATLSLGLNWFFGQKDTTGYHVVNFMIHLINSLLLFAVILKLFDTPRLKNIYPAGQVAFIAITASSFWALNPVQTQAVTYIVQRMTSLAALFSLLALLSYLAMRNCKPGARRALLCSGAIVSYMLAFFSKENSVLIILVLPILEVIFFKQIILRWNLKRIVVFAALAAIFCVAFTLAISPDIIDIIPKVYAKRPFTLMERVLTEQRIMLFYLSILFFPHPGRLSIQHDILLSTSLFSPITTILAILLNLVIFTTGLLLLKRQPLLSFAILFFYLNHLVESTFIPLELLFEHRNYLPSLFLFLPVAQFFLFLINRVNAKLFTTTMIYGLAGLLATLAFATYTRNQAWQTTKSLWSDAARKAPQSGRPLSSLAYDLAWGGHERSEENDRKSLEINKKTLILNGDRTDTDTPTLGNIAILYFRLGEYDESIAAFEKALAASPGDNHMRYRYANHLLWLGEVDKAEEETMKILQTGYNHRDIWLLFGIIKIWNNQVESGLKAIRAAMTMAPNRYDANLNLGKAFSLLGDHNRARMYYKRAEILGDAEVSIELTLLRLEDYLTSGDIDKARKEVQKALSNYPLTELTDRLKDDFKDKYRYAPLKSELIQSLLRTELAGNDYFISQ